MLGYSRPSFISASVKWDEITPRSGAPPRERAMAQLTRRSVAAPWEKELIRKDGSHHILAARAMLDGSEGMHRGRGDRERKRAETDLLERNAARGAERRGGDGARRRATVSHPSCSECAQASARTRRGPRAHLTLNPWRNVLDA